MFNNISDMTNLKEIIIENDLNNIKKDSLTHIINNLNLELGNIKNEIIQTLFKKHLDDIFKEEELRNVFLNEAFAGKGSLKWYKLNFGNEKIKYQEKVSSRLETNKIYNYNLKNNQTFEYIKDEELETPKVFGTVKLNDGIYFMRVLVPGNLRSFNDGVNIRRMRTINNLIVIINLNEEYIEIRSNNKFAKSIKENILNDLFKFKDYKVDIIEYDILYKYNNSLEKFKEDCLYGKFINVRSIPMYDIELDDQESEVLVSTLEILNNYFSTKNKDELNQLKSIDIDPINMTFVQLFLSGLSGIGLDMNEDIDSDLSNQSLYNLLKPYLEDRSGFISFNLDPENNIKDRKTILVGNTTNTIAFRSSSTEKHIKYIREKVL